MTFSQLQRDLHSQTHQQRPPELGVLIPPSSEEYPESFPAPQLTSSTNSSSTKSTPPVVEAGSKGQRSQNSLYPLPEVGDLSLNLDQTPTSGSSSAPVIPDANTQSAATNPAKKVCPCTVHLFN